MCQQKVISEPAHDHQEFAMAAGEMSDAEFEEFLNAFLRSALNLTTDKALFYVCMDWRHIRPFERSGKDAATDAPELVCLGQDKCRDGILLPFTA